MRYFTLGLLLALTLALASLTAAGEPTSVSLPGFDLLELVLDWLGIFEAKEAPALETQMKEPNGIDDFPPRVPETTAEMGPGLEPGG